MTSRIVSGLRVGMVLVAAVACEAVDSTCVVDREGACQVGEEMFVEVEELAPELDKALTPPTELVAADPWLHAQELEALDGIPRVPLWTAHGLTLAPYKEVSGHAIVGGDVDLGPLEILADKRERGVTLDEAWFPDGVIRWYTKDIAESTTESRIEWAADFLEERTPLNFIEVSSSTSSRALEFRGTNASSYGGMTYDYWDSNDPKPVLRLSEKSGPAKKGTILHELGHALGFPHEFQRDDRDDFVDVCFNLDPFNYAKMGSHVFWSGQDPELLSPFDFASIMHSGYSSCVTPLSGFSWEDPDYDGNDQRMSIHDINSIYRVYADNLGTVEDDTRFGAAVTTGDFDDDGFVDVAVASLEPGWNNSYGYVYMNLFRGVATDESEGGAGRAYIPWFRQTMVYKTNLDGELVATTGDFNGDGIDDIALGDPTANGNEGRIGVLIVNTPDRFGSYDGPWGGKNFESVDWIYPDEVGLSEGMSHRFGASLAAGHLTSNSYDDLVVGAPTAKQGTGMLITKTGGAVVHLKRAETSSVAITWNPGFGAFHSYNQFGAAVTVLPDFCKPSSTSETRYDVFAVGIPAYNGSRGAMRLYGCARSASSPVTPSLVKELTHSQSGAQYGFALQGVTVSSGSTPEFYILTAAPYYDSSSKTDIGRVYLDEFDSVGNKTYISGYTPGSGVGSDEFGYALGVYQDTLNDKDDIRFAIGAPNTEKSGVRSGRLFIWNPWVNGVVHHSATILNPGSRTAGMRYGASVAALDGSEDIYGFAIAAPWATVSGDESGRVDVRLNNDPDIDDWSSDTSQIHLGTTGDRRPNNL